MSGDNIVHHWAPVRGYERRALPTTTDSWDPVTSPVAMVLRGLRELGVEDPTKASEFYATATSLRAHTITVAAKQDPAVAITARLAQGELSPDEAGRLLGKAPKPSDAREQEERETAVLYAATRQAYSAAVRAVHDFGDRWLGVLRPLIEEAVTARDDERFAQVHAFGSLLRSSPIGALAMVGDQSGTRETSETWRYTSAAPHRYHLWRVERAQDARPIFHEVVGDVTFVAGAVVKAPHPTVAEMAEHGMEPGIYSAQEVLAIASRIVIQQEQEREMAAGEPAPPRRMVAM